MNKKYLAVIAAMLVITAMLAACTNKNDENRVVTDREGNTHILATDENGETMQDENGNIIEVLTDANGKEIVDSKKNQYTQAITYPDILEVDGYAENQYLRIKIEKGWEQTGFRTIEVNNKNNGAQYILDVKEGKTLEEVAGSYNSMVEAMKASPAYIDPTISTEEVEIGGIKMKKITIQYSINKEYLEEGDLESQILYVYLHEKDGKIYNFQGSVLPQYKNDVDFDKIIASIEYK